MTVEKLELLADTSPNLKVLRLPLTYWTPEQDLHKGDSGEPCPFEMQLMATLDRLDSLESAISDFCLRTASRRARRFDGGQRSANSRSPWIGAMTRMVCPRGRSFPATTPARPDSVKRRSRNDIRALLARRAPFRSITLGNYGESQASCISLNAVEFASFAHGLSHESPRRAAATFVTSRLTESPLPKKAKNANLPFVDGECTRGQSSLVLVV